jgi:vancomycin resistance protein YoaR
MTQQGPGPGQGGPRPGQPGQPGYPGHPGPGQQPPHLPPPPAQGKRRSPTPFIIGGAVALIALGYAGLVFVAGGKVPSGTTVAGVSIGGLSKAAAEQELRQQLNPKAGEAIQLAVGKSTYDLKPADAGLALDVPGTVDAAYVGHTINPVTLFDALSGGEAVAPVLTVDDGKLSAALKQVAAKTDKKPQEGTITFTGGTPKAVLPVEGQVLDLAKASDVLRAEFLVGGGPVELPTKLAEPKVSKAEVERAMSDFAVPAMSGPVTLKIAGKSVEAKPEQVGPALSLAAGGSGKLEPKLDGAKLLKSLGGSLKSVLTKPQDAKIEISGGKPKVVPAKPGHSIPPASLSAAVVPALAKTGDQRVAEVKTEEAEPALTTKEVEAYGVKQVVGSFSTDFPHATNPTPEYRNINIGRAAELINGTLIKPGGTFSMNDIVGERTEENGFTNGLVIKGGALQEELGGGVSQVATTTYNAAFFAGMQDVEHRPHGFYISRYPVGREATVYWGSLDLKWKNTTPYAVYVQAWRDKSSPGSQGSVTVRLWSTKYYTVKTKTSERYKMVAPETKYDEKKTCVEQPEGVPGFQVDVYRWLYRGGKQVDEEKDHVKYNPEHKVICGKKPEDPPPTQ